ncbi:unnamed protein product [Ixodes persulcatus]
MTPRRGLPSIPTQVDTMTGLVPVRHQSFESLGVDVAELPYQGGDYSMVIVLPKQNDGVEVLKQNLRNVLIRDLVSQLVDRQVRKPQCAWCKFKLETEYSLRNLLQNLGIRRIIGPGADLSGITEDNDIQASAVVHKAFVKVNEEGTEAAAVSGAVFVTTTLGLPTVEFKVDPPFLFFIRNTRTKDVMFAGQVTHL